MIYKLQNGGTYTHNDYYGYVNKIQEKAISNPEWFWSDAQDASEARQWLYDNDASSVVENIYNNTPEEFRSTINNKYLPTNIQQNNFNSGITSTTTDAAKDIGKAALAAGSVGMAGAGLLPMLTAGSWAEALTAASPLLTGAVSGTLGSIYGGGVGSLIGLGKAVNEYRNNPQDEHSLQNGIPTVTGYNKSISWEDRGMNGMLSGLKKGSAIGGFLGGLFGGYRGRTFKNWESRNFDWDEVSSNLSNYHNNFGSNIDQGRLKWFNSYRPGYENVKGISDFLSKTKIEARPIDITAGGEYYTHHNKININNNPLHVLFAGRKGLLAHEGEHAVQDLLQRFHKGTPGSWYTMEIPDQPVGKLFARSLGKRNRIGAWARGPIEFDSDMANLRQVTGQNAPYSKMTGFPRWFTRLFMKNRFHLNNKQFDTAVRAQEQALIDPWAPIE